MGAGTQREEAMKSEIETMIAANADADRADARQTIRESSQSQEEPMIRYYIQGFLDQFGQHWYAIYDVQARAYVSNPAGGPMFFLFAKQAKTHCEQRGMAWTDSTEVAAEARRQFARVEA